MLSREPRYKTLAELSTERDNVAWCWRFLAFTASWMILGGYLLLPSTYDKNPQLRFSPHILSIFIVALLTTGYSLTALLYFACHSSLFHRDSVFLPSFASSLLGLLTVLYNFISSTRYAFTTGAIASLVLSCASTTIYAILYFLNYRKVSRLQNSTSRGSYTPAHTAAQNIYYSDPNYYTNFVQNMYPVAYASPSPDPSPNPSYPTTTEDHDFVAHQMALLLTKADPGPSPDAMTETFRINMPGDPSEEVPVQAGSVREYHERSNFLNVGAVQRTMWERMTGRPHERGRSEGRERSDERAKSREERRTEIELGIMQA